MTDRTDDYNDKRPRDSNSYEVGYCKPPKHTQFRPGVSGNPSGGRRKPFGFRVEEWTNPFVDYLLEPVEVNVKGKKTKVSRYERWIREIIREALEGNPDSSMTLLEETDCLRVLIDDQYCEPSEADRAYVEQVEQEATMFSVEARQPDAGEHNGERR